MEKHVYPNQSSIRIHQKQQQNHIPYHYHTLIWYYIVNHAKINTLNSNILKENKYEKLKGEPC